MLAKFIATLLANATWWEWCWTVPALITSVLRWILLGLSFGDWGHVGSEQKRKPSRDVEPEQTWAGFQFLQKIILVLVLLAMATFGAVAMFSPPSVQPPPPPTKVTYTLTVVFILIPTLLAADAILELVSRHRTQVADKRRTDDQRRRVGDVPLPIIISEQIEQARKEAE
jgi:hypothetical protein